MYYLMSKIKSSYVFFLASFFMLLSLPLLARNDCKTCGFCDNSDSEVDCDSFWGISVEARVAYFHPLSKKVRRIYGHGWADYQLEFSKSLNRLCGFGKWCCCDGFEDIDLRIWTGVSGFSKKGRSIGFHDATTLQLIPINLGLKIFCPIFCNTEAFVGAAACYSLLRIHDHSPYVHQHIRKESWGALLQSGITYHFCKWIYASLFFDYYFQRFHFHENWFSSFSESSEYSISNSSSRYVERFDLEMHGYKIGLGLGISF